MGNIAIATGASSGMGRAIAERIIKSEKFDEVWVIARREERLLELTKLSEKTKVRPVPLDLNDAAALARFDEMIKEEKPSVGMLVNCAGFGKFGKYDEIPLSSSIAMIDLNCKALVYITETVLPFMPNGANIINLDSLSAFQPVPYLNVYGSTKAFVLSYSRGLAAELRERNIKVLAVCPGWVKTEFFNDCGNEKNHAVTYFSKWFTADEVADAAMKAVGKSRVIVPSITNKLQVLLVKLMPAKFVVWVWMKQQNHW